MTLEPKLHILIICLASILTFELLLIPELSLLAALSLTQARRLAPILVML